MSGAGVMHLSESAVGPRLRRLVLRSCELVTTEALTAVARRYLGGFDEGRGYVTSLDVMRARPLT